MGLRSLRANRQLRYASLAIRTKVGGHEILLPMSPDTSVTYLPGRSQNVHGAAAVLLLEISTLDNALGLSC